MSPPLQRYARVLTIAGSDSGGGAGIQADLKTFSALGCYGMSAITALTAQNTTGVRAIHAVPPQMLRDQIDAVVEDIGVDAVKIGMLHAPEIVQVVAQALDRHRLPQGGAQRPHQARAILAALQIGQYHPGVRIFSQPFDDIGNLNACLVACGDPV